MITLKFYDKDTLKLITTKNYEERFTIFEAPVQTDKEIINAFLLRLILPSNNNLEELLDILNDKVILEASDEGGILVRILCSIFNYKLELSDEYQQVIALNIHDRIYSWDSYKK